MATEANQDRARRRVALLARLERWTEWPLLVLALLLLIVLLLPAVVDLSSEAGEVLDGLDLLIWGVFAADLVAKVAIAPHRGRYLRSHWLDVALVALPFLRPLRLARSARLVRLLRLTRFAVAVGRAEVGVRQILTRHGLHYVLGVATVVVIVAGAAMTAVERGEPDATIRDLPDGLWWAVTTITTVGYGDTYPRTAAGRGIGVALMLLGISLFGIVTANVAAFFVGEREDEVLAELKALRMDVQQLAARMKVEGTDRAT